METAVTQSVYLHGEIGTPREEWKEVRSSLISEPQMLESIVSLTLLSEGDHVMRGPMNYFLGAHELDIRDFD